MNHRKRKLTERIDHLLKMNLENQQHDVFTECGSEKYRPLMPLSSDISKLPDLEDFNIPSYQIVILIQQYLYSRGYTEAANILAKQSSVPYNSENSKLFENYILNGDYLKALEVFSKISEADDEGTKRTIRLLIIEHYFIETIELGNNVEALRILRSYIAPELQNQGKLLHLLTHLLEFQNNLTGVNDDSGNNNSSSNGIHIRDPPPSRNSLINSINALSPHTVCMGENRLEKLLRYSMMYQLEKCPLHSSLELFTVKSSLLMDHQCNSNDLPSVCSQVLDCHKDNVWQVEFSNDGKYFAGCSKDRQLVIYHESSCKVYVKEKFFKFLHVPYMFKWSPDDRMILLITTYNKHLVYICKINSSSPNDVISNSSGEVETITCCDWFPDSQRYVTGAISGNITIMNIDGTALFTHRGYRVQCLSVINRGSNILFADHIKRLNLLDVETCRNRVLYQEENCITNMALCPDTVNVILNVKGTGNHLFSLESCSVVRSFTGAQQNGCVLNCSFRPGHDSKIFAGGSENGRIHYWHTNKSEPIKVLATNSKKCVNSVSWNPIDPNLLLSSGDDNLITVWRTRFSL